MTNDASAGPRVSDELLSHMPVSDDTIQHIIEYGRGIEKDVAFDLQSARTALATANARIAVLEAETERLQGLWDRERQRTDWLVDKAMPGMAYTDVDDDLRPQSDYAHPVMQIDIADFEAFLAAIEDDATMQLRQGGQS